jgi:DNA (cytosine-5)-methyltransferase 1
MKRLTHLSLFTGIGGIDLAAEAAGFETIGQCEINPYCRDVLYRRFPDVKRWNDVRQITKDEIDNTIGIPTLISGGFPCQPHSGAGQRKASCDSRDLWPEVRRILREIKPRWFVGENVAGLRSSEGGKFLGRIFWDLAEMGYRVGWGTWEAAHVGAPHHRERIFVVAYSEYNGFVSTEISTGVESRSDRCQTGEKGAEQPEGSGCSTGGDEVLAHSCGTGLEGAEQHRAYREGTAPEQTCPLGAVAQRSSLPDWRAWGSEPRMGRVAYGVPKRVDRLKCLGNAVVPAQIYPLLQEIADYEKS